MEIIGKDCNLRIDLTKVNYSCNDINHLEKNYSLYKLSSLLSLKLLKVFFFSFFS